MMRKSFILLACFAVACLCGCADQDSKLTQHEAAEKQWNNARAMVLMGLARDEYNSGDFDRGRTNIDAALKLVPDMSPALVLSAKLYIETGQLEAAQHELDAARKVDATNAEIDYFSGVVSQRWQNPQQALECYRHACEKAPTESAYVMAQAETLAGMNRGAEALALLTGKLPDFDHSGPIRDEIGLLMMQQGRFHEAADVLRQATILTPDDPTIREHLATALYNDLQYGDAGMVLAELIGHPGWDHRADLLMMLGDCDLQTAQLGDAVENFTVASQMLPTSPAVWLSLARAQLQVGNLPQADVAIARAVALRPDGTTYLLLGYLRMRQNRDPEALAAFEQASRLDPTDTVSICMVGVAQQKLGRLDDAAASYQRALAQKPNDEMATALMARLRLHE